MAWLTALSAPGQPPREEEGRLAVWGELHPPEEEQGALLGMC